LAYQTVTVHTGTNTVRTTNGHPGVMVRSINGKYLFYAYSENYSGSLWRVACRSSDDNGVTWSSPVIIEDNIDSPESNPSICIDKYNRLFIFYFNNVVVKYAYSDDNGATFSTGTAYGSPGYRSCAVTTRANKVCIFFADDTTSVSNIICAYCDAQTLSWTSKSLSVTNANYQPLSAIVYGDGESILVTWNSTGNNAIYACKFINDDWDSAEFELLASAGQSNTVVSSDGINGHLVYTQAGVVGGSLFYRTINLDTLEMGSQVTLFGSATYNALTPCINVDMYDNLYVFAHAKTAASGSDYYIVGIEKINGTWGSEFTVYSNNARSPRCIQNSYPKGRGGYGVGFNKYKVQIGFHDVANYRAVYIYEDNQQFISNPTVSSAEGFIQDIPVDLPAYIENRGTAEPIYGIHITPSAYYYNGKSYFVYQGDSTTSGSLLNPYILCYDHSTTTVSGPVKVGTNPMTTDNHGAPCIIVDNSGYIHVFYGAHISALKYAKSTNPEDISSWTAQSDIGSDITYPNLLKDGSSGIIYMLHRGVVATGNGAEYIRTSADAFASATKIIDFGSQSNIYVSKPYLDESSGRIYIAWNYHDMTALNIRSNIYCAYYNISDGNMYALDDTNLGSVVDKTEANNYCLVYDSHTAGLQVTDTTVTLDSSGNVLILSVTEISSGEYWTTFHKYSGGSWSSKVDVRKGAGYQTVVFADPDGSNIDALLFGNVDNPPDVRGGNPEIWRYNGTSWSKVKTLMTMNDYGRLFRGGEYVNNRPSTGPRWYFAHGRREILVSDVKLFVTDENDNFID